MEKSKMPELRQKAAIYLRVSTKLQIDKDSLHVQKHDLIAYSEVVLGIREYEIFEDPGFSGKNTDRPRFQAMMTRLRSGEFSHLLVWKIDRVSRNLLDFAAMYKELKQIGVTFVSKNEQFDTSTAIGEAMLKIILVFAELERNMTSERVGAVMKTRAKEGRWNGGTIPYGYDWDKKTKTISVNEKESRILRLMFDLFNEKQNLKAVANILNDKGYRSRRGNKWSPVTIHEILKNVWYTGTYMYNRCADARHTKPKDPSEWVIRENNHTALITKDEYDRHLRSLSMNRRGGHKIGDSYDTRFVHIFAGLVICGNCGANVTANRGKPLVSGWSPTTYGCATRRRHGNKCPNKFKSEVFFSSFMLPLISSIICAKTQLSGDATATNLEKYILSRMEQPVKHITGLEQLLDLMRTNEKAIDYFYPLPSEVSDDREIIENLRDQKRRIETKLQRLQSLYLHGDNSISESDYIIERAQFMSELASVDKKLSELPAVGEMAEDEFVLRASSFIMIDKLLNYKKGTSSKLISTIDPKVPKHFFNAILSRITMTSGNITKIVFKNKLTLEFEY